MSSASPRLCRVTRLRVLPALVLVLSGLALLAPPAATAALAEVCNPSPKTASSLCLTYGFTVTDTGTDTETTKTQHPVDLALAFANTSDNYVDEGGRPRWLNRVAASFPGTLLLAPSSQLPDELLIAGGAVGQDCPAGADYAFTACEAGYGVAYVAGVPLYCPGVCKATFGVRRIVNQRDNLSTYGQYRAELAMCLDANGGTPSCDLAQDQTATVEVERSAVGAPFKLAMAVPASDLVDDITIDTATLHLIGTATQLSDGSTVAAKDVIRLPARCGVSTVSGSVTSNGGTTVTASIPFETTGCADLILTSSRPVLTFGQESLLSGVLTDYDNAHAPMPGATITLRQCPVGKACATRSTTTDADGRYAFTVKPVGTTAYTVTHPYDGTHPAVSLATTVKVKPLVTIQASATKVRSGGSVKLAGAVKPAHAGKTVVIQRKVAGVWTRIATATLTSRSLYAKVVVLKGARGSKALLRVVLPAHPDHLVGTSPTVTVTFS